MLERMARSLRHALRGIAYTFREERNFRIESVFALVVGVLIYVLDVTYEEGLILTLLIAFVLVLELINTALERVVNVLKPRLHPYARVIKDVMAGAVLLTALAASIIGWWILWPDVSALYFDFFGL